VDSLTRRIAVVTLALPLAALLASSTSHGAGLSVRSRADDLVNAAMALYREGEYSQAAEKLQAALRARPGYAPAHQLLAVTYHALRDPDKALDHYWAVQRLSFPPLPKDATKAQTRERELLVACEAVLAIQLNNTRMERNLGLCIPDVRLARVARQHSNEMRDKSYFAHGSPTPGYETITDRFRRVFGDLRIYSIAENIAQHYATGYYSLSTGNAHETHSQWMNSPGHRTNILTPKFNHVGLGIAANRNGDYWATQFFAQF